MKKYQIVFIGDKKLEINEEEKQKVERAWKSKLMCTVRGNTFNTNTIRGIFELETSPAPSSKMIEATETEWNDNMKKYADQDVKTKVAREIQCRVLPGWKLSKLPSGTDDSMKARRAIRIFFEQNPTFPWCPMEVWWDFIKDHLRQSVYISRYYEYVMRHEDQCRRYYRKNQMKPNFQTALTVTEDNSTM